MPRRDVFIAINRDEAPKGHDSVTPTDNLPTATHVARKNVLN